MSIIRIGKRPRYTVVSNEPIDNPDVDFGALGLLTYLLSKPDDWEVSIAHLCKQKKAGETVIRRLLKELITAGYASFKRANTGKTEWTIYECSNDHISPYVEKPHVEKPHVDNQAQVITDKTTNTETNNKNTIELSHGFEDWWKLYPRKKSKQKALSIWKAKKLCHQSDSLIEKLQNQVSHCESMNGEIKYIKHPTTYLNAGAWDDDIEPIGESNGSNPKRETQAEQFERNMEQLKRQANGFDLGQDVIDVSDEMDGSEWQQLSKH